MQETGTIVGCRGTGAGAVGRLLTTTVVCGACCGAGAIGNRLTTRVLLALKNTLVFTAVTVVVEGGGKPPRTPVARDAKEGAPRDEPMGDRSPDHDADLPAYNCSKNEH